MSRMGQLSFEFVQVKSGKVGFKLQSEKKVRVEFQKRNPHCHYVWDQICKKLISCPVSQFLTAAEWSRISGLIAANAKDEYLKSV